MDTKDLFDAMRQQGYSTDEAAAMVGYAMVARESGWKCLGLPRHTIRQVKRAFARAAIDPLTVTFAPMITSTWEPAPLPAGLHQGTIRSGAI